MGSLSERLKKYDRIFIGIVLGGILPIIGFVISYFIKTFSRDISFEHYLNIALNNSIMNEQQDILIWGLIPNMLLFYFTNFRWGLYEITKGLVGVTLILGLGIILISL